MNDIVNTVVPILVIAAAIWLGYNVIQKRKKSGGNGGSNGSDNNVR